MDGFEILEKLGDGAYSVVYKVRRKEDSKIYALKKVNLANLSQKEKENSLNEVRILASVKSTFVIAYKEAFIDESDQSLCIVMEYADKGDLYQKITQFKKMGCLIDEVDIWRIFIQMTKGLKALHDLKILHRDLKSANIFLFSDGSAKIGDLNVSKVAYKGLGYTQTGTPYYASPEVRRDEPYDMKSDIWSLGCVTYEMLALHPPFRAENMEKLYNKVIQCQYGKISERYSDDIKEIIKLLLKVKTKDRPTCAQILKHPLVKKRLEFFQAQAGNDNIDIDDMEEGVLLRTIRIPSNLLCLSDKLPEANYENPFKQRKLEFNRNKINTKGNTFPNSNLPDIKCINKTKNENINNEEQKVFRETELKLKKNKIDENLIPIKRKELKIELFNKTKLLNIETKFSVDKNKRNKNVVTELHSNYSLNKRKHKLNLSKHLSNSKNKINLSIKKDEKIYKNHEEKVDNDPKKDEIMPDLNTLTHKRRKKNGNKKMKEMQKYFNDLGINDTYKLYIPQLEIHNSNKNSINNDFKIKIEKLNTKKIENRYVQNLPNLYQYKIRKNNSNSLNHYDNKKYDIIPKPVPNRKINLLLNKKFGIKLI
jgi:NIMA (never in mitosis gene a)-related kinase